MKKIFFSDEENLSEKAFIQGIATCLFSIVLCLIALCSVTWAWFSTDVSSSSNTIQTGSYRLQIEVVEKVSMTSIAASEESQTSCRYDLKSGDYQIKLSVKPNSVKNGYCKITIDGVSFYTDRISLDDLLFSFDLRMQTDASVTFEWRWGSYSGIPDISRDAALIYSTDIKVPKRSAEF